MHRTGLMCIGLDTLRSCFYAQTDTTLIRPDQCARTDTELGTQGGCFLAQQLLGSTDSSSVHLWCTEPVN
jgi:hypothetical protein